MPKEPRNESPPTTDEWDELTATIYTWEEEEQTLIGRIEKITPFTAGKFDTEVDQYFIKTPEGMVTTVLGSATDKQLKDKVAEGDTVRIVFKGVKDLDDGRHCNIFHVAKRSSAP